MQVDMNLKTKKKIRKNLERVKKQRIVNDELGISLLFLCDIRSRSPSHDALNQQGPPTIRLAEAANCRQQMFVTEMLEVEE